MTSFDFWNRIKSQADIAFNIVNKSIQDTGVLTALSTKPIEVEIKDTIDDLLNQKLANKIIIENDESKSERKCLTFKNYIQAYYKNQLENKEYAKWDLNVNSNLNDK